MDHVLTLAYRYFYKNVYIINNSATSFRGYSLVTSRSTILDVGDGSEFYWVQPVNEMKLVVDSILT